MMRLDALLTILLASFFFFSGCCAQQEAGCDQTGAYPASQFDILVKQLKDESNELIREDLLKELVQNSTKGFNSTQTLTLLSLFRNEIIMEEIIQFLNPFILGITCEECLQFLRTFNNELIRLDILKYTVNLTIDLEKNNETLLTTFQNVFNKRDAQDIIDHAAPRSCVWGDVTAKRLIFVVDTSGSMGTTFKSSIDGKTYTRLQFVAQQLDTVIRKNLQSDQEFNVISFAFSPNAWKPGIVPVNSGNVDSAVQFVSRLTPNGGTSMLSALNLAFSDKQAIAIYLLTDGVPTDASPNSILQAAEAWSKGGNESRYINSIAFMAGGTPDPNAAKFMQQLAQATGGIYRSVQ